MTFIKYLRLALLMTLAAIADISDYWEFSATGIRLIDESNEAYKLGVNYTLYGVTP